MQDKQNHTPIIAYETYEVHGDTVIVTVLEALSIKAIEKTCDEYSKNKKAGVNKFHIKFQQPFGAFFRTQVTALERDVSLIIEKKIVECDFIEILVFPMDDVGQRIIVWKKNHSNSKC